MQNFLGQGIPGVEVLAYPVNPRAARGPSAIFKTDADGRFRLAGLLPGSYFLALNKPGYEILLAQINTRWVSRLTLTLVPGSGVRPSPAPRDDSMDWVLRVPRTDLLKEIGPEEAAASLPGEGPGPAGSTAGAVSPRGPGGGSGSLPFSGEVQQWFTADPTFAEGGSDAASSGRTTALKLDGDLFGKGNWRVGGVLGTLSTQSAAPGAGGSGLDEGAGRLRVAMNYDLGQDDSVRFRARYDKDTFHGTLWPDPVVPPSQEVRTLGYQAGWTRKLDQGSGLEMRVGYVQAQGRVPAAGPAGISGAWPQEDGSLLDRRWEAGAQYGFNLSPDHRLQVGAATRYYSYEQRDQGWILAPIQPELSLAEAGQKGWSVSLSGEDAWRISDPLSLILGLDVHRDEGLSGFSAVVPRVGARRESGRTMIQGQILFRMDAAGAGGGGTPQDSGPTYPSEAGVGFRAEVLRRIGASWTVSGHAERNPIGLEQADGWAEGDVPGNSAALLLADPASVTDEVGVRVSKRLKGVEGSVGTDQGRVRGRIAARLDGAPIQILGPGDVRYLTFKASASVTGTDTEVRVDYHRLDGLESGSRAGDPYQASRLDLTLLQQVPLLGKRLPADWRVLVAYQTLVRSERGALDSQEALLPERVRRISGGIGVKF